MASTTHPSFKVIAGPKVIALIEFLLEKYEVIEPGTGTIPTVDSIMQDEGLQRLIINIGKDLKEAEEAEEEKPKKKVVKKKSSPKKTEPKKSSPKKSLQERNAEAFDGCRCSARMWEAEKGLGYDSIQCSKATKVSKEDAEDTLNEFKEKMNEDQLAKLPEYIEKYDGCFCKNHLKQDFFMPKGWWLGKVNESRPEKPMLPKGSFKDGYQDDYKEHQWMHDSDGKVVEKPKKKIIKKKKKIIKKKKVEETKVEPKVEPEVAAEEPKVEPKAEVEEKKDEVVESSDTETEPLSDEEKPLDEDEENYEADEYEVDGVTYMKIWDDEDKMWIITDPESGEHVGFPDGNGGIKKLE